VKFLQMKIFSKNLLLITIGLVCIILSLWASVEIYLYCKVGALPSRGRSIARRLVFIDLFLCPMEHDWIDELMERKCEVEGLDSVSRVIFFYFIIVNFEMQNYRAYDFNEIVGDSDVNDLINLLEVNLCVISKDSISEERIRSWLEILKVRASDLNNNHLPLKLPRPTLTAGPDGDSNQPGQFLVKSPPVPGAACARSPGSSTSRPPSP
jgi:hypothetical protein